MKKVGIMQPYFFPYIGYFQLLNSVDEYVLYDNIEFTKKGWINRNRILVNGSDHAFTLPLKKDSDYLFVDARYLADSWTNDRSKLLNRFKESYRKAPYFNVIFPLLEQMVLFNDTNLFKFIENSIKSLCTYLEIHTKITISSTVQIDHSMKGEQKVIALCKALGADTYVNPIGGVELYDSKRFKENDIDLYFLKSQPIEYPQLQHEFVPWLSIVDVLMFNDKEQVKELLNKFTLIQNV